MQVTALFAAVLTLIYLGLALRVVYLRRTRRVGIGDGGDPDLALAVRAHGNFAEYVPLALILIGLMEMIQLPAFWLYVFGLVLLLGRILHAWGLSRTQGVSLGRFWGTVLTWTCLLGAALVLLYWTLARLVLTG